MDAPLRRRRQPWKVRPTGRHTLAVLESERPDLVFLDIQLAGETGFDLLERARAADFKTVFVTAFDEYAIRAFEVNALDYLLKPVNPALLKKALDKLLAGDTAPTAAPLRPLDIDDRLYLELGGRSGEPLAVSRRHAARLKEKFG